MAALEVDQHNDVEALLANFLREAARKTVRYGGWDCGLWLADWVRLWRGVEDPAADLRGQYADAAEADLLFHNGLVVGRRARAAGLKMTRDPEIGAIAIVGSPEGPAGAIRTRYGWALLNMRGGIVRAPAKNVRVLAAWGSP